MPHIALVTTAAARDLDDDLAPLTAALRAQEAEVSIVDWDDTDTDWSRFDLALLRSPWDYTQRVPEFLAWAARAARADATAQSARRGALEYRQALPRRSRRTPACAIVPSRSSSRARTRRAALDAFLARARGGGRIRRQAVRSAPARATRSAMRAATRTPRSRTCARLLDAGRSVLLQPYLDRVDDAGETALIFFDGAVQPRDPQGRRCCERGEGPTARAVRDRNRSRRARRCGRARSGRTTLRLPRFRSRNPTAAYARVDLIRDDDGAPRLLELELAEPSLFFAQAAGSAARFARALLARARTHAGHGVTRSLDTRTGRSSAVFIPELSTGLSTSAVDNNARGRLPRRGTVSARIADLSAVLASFAAAPAARIEPDEDSGRLQARRRLQRAHPGQAGRLRRRHRRRQTVRQSVRRHRARRSAAAARERHRDRSRSSRRSARPTRRRTSATVWRWARTARSMSSPPTRSSR